jgi:hypothetical protein
MLYFYFFPLYIFFHISFYYQIKIFLIKYLFLRICKSKFTLKLTPSFASLSIFGVGTLLAAWFTLKSPAPKSSPIRIMTFGLSSAKICENMEKYFASFMICNDVFLRLRSNTMLG